MHDTFFLLLPVEQQQDTPSAILGMFSTREEAEDERRQRKLRAMRYDEEAKRWWEAYRSTFPDKELDRLPSEEFEKRRHVFTLIHGGYPPRVWKEFYIVEVPLNMRGCWSLRVPKHLQA